MDLVLEGVTIEAVAAEGRALTHVHLPSEPEDGPGRVLFTDPAVPGDIVDVRVTKKKKNFLEGRIIDIRKPSPHRLEPFCEHFGVCGGCRWQVLPYEMQLEAKRQQVYDQLVRIGHLEVPEIRPVIPSEKTVYYRNKLEFSASSKRWILPTEDPATLSDSEKCGLGFHVGGFFDKVLDIKKCFLQDDPSNDIRLFVKDYAVSNGISFYDLRENRGIFRGVFVRNSSLGALMVIVCFSQRFDGLEPMLKALSDRFPQITSLYYVINAKVNDSISDQQCILWKGEEYILEEMEGLRFRVGPKSFYQTNPLQALKLYRTARDFACLDGSQTVYDLYTGTGTIAQFVSSKAAKVIGIEYVQEAVDDAVENARLNSIGNCEFFAGDMHKILTADFIRDHGRPDVIILDPPRAGIHPDVASVILDASPERIVYVSCNPASQARDLAVLCSKYEITAVQPVDMFPHTHHVENVCQLNLK